MAGLLDFLQTPDAQLGMQLLAAGGYSPTPMGAGQRITGALQNFQSQRDADVMRRVQLAKAMQDLEFNQQFVGGTLPGIPGLSGKTPASATAGASAGTSAPAAAGVAPGGEQAAQMSAAGIAQRYNVPIEAVLADYKFNGGKKIAELISERSKPSWTNVNGNLVNTNAPGFTGGVQGGVSAGNDGRVTQWVPDGRGGLVVGAPAGALETYGAYQGIGNRSAADFQPETVIDGTTGQKVVRPRSQVLQPAPALGRQVGPGYAGGSASAAVGGQADIMRTELDRAQQEFAAAQQRGDMAGAARAQADVAGIQREMQRLPGGAGAMNAGNVVELSPAQQTANAAQKTLLEGVAKGAADSVTSSQAGAQSALGTLQNVDLMRKGLGNAIVGPGADTRISLARVGQVLGVAGRDAAEQLSNTRTLMQGLSRQELSAAGQMKGQGQITESERAILRKAESGDVTELTGVELQTLIGILDRSARYRLDSHQKLMSRVNSGESPGQLMTVAAPTAESPKAPALLQALPTANASNKGQRIRDTTTGKILMSNGMQWKEQ